MLVATDIKDPTVVAVVLACTVLEAETVCEALAGMTVSTLVTVLKLMVWPETTVVMMAGMTTLVVIIEGIDVMVACGASKYKKQ